ASPTPLISLAPPAPASVNVQALSSSRPMPPLSIAVVTKTNGLGVWVRREPAGEPIKVWPEGAPMAIIGPDQQAAGIVWRHVRTLDAESGWVAADYLADADAEALVEEVGGIRLAAVEDAPAPAAS